MITKELIPLIPFNILHWLCFTNTLWEYSSEVFVSKEIDTSVL